MLKLDMIVKDYPNTVIYLAARHIVGIYPSRHCDGSYIELVTHTIDDTPAILVAQSPAEIGKMSGWNNVI